MGWGGRITWLAFLGAIVLVCVRATLVEMLRDPSPVVPGSEAAPRGVGPATTLLLNLACCLPAMGVLLRRLLDRTYVIRWSISHLIMGLLAAWMLLSIAWAGDKFAAMVQATTFTAALAILWAAAQLVRSWQRLRLVVAAAFAMLLLYIACGYEYRLIDLPDNQRYFQENREIIFKQRGIEPGSAAAESFERKVKAGDLGCFVVSPNSYGAALIFLIVVAGGVVIQRAVWRDHPASWLVVIVLVLPAAYVIHHTHSRTANTTPVLAAMMLGGVALLRPWLARRARIAYWLGFALVALGVAAVVGHGLYHESLVEKSMTFRWYYWTGAARLVEEQPLTGVGWANFGQRYTAVRLPLATEEVQDPHNFIVRAFAELGIVGGLLILAWVSRLWWELTRPIHPDENKDGSYFSPRAWTVAAGIGAAFMLLGVIVGSDWGHDSAWVLLQAFRRGIGAILLIAAIMIVAQRSMTEEHVDPRPAPWILYAALAALAVFFIHNMVDFALFETGPMYLFALITGALLGVRQPSVAGRRRKTALVAGAFTAVVVMWLWGAGYFWARTAQAEGLAAEGDAAVRRGNVDLAAARYVEAFNAQPFNADYAIRAAEAGIMASRHPTFVRGMIDAAIATNPHATWYHRLKAQHAMRLPSPDRITVEAAYRRALEGDPQNVPLRIEFADVLAQLGETETALDQYREAMRMDDQLPKDEPKRMGEKKRGEVERRVEELSRVR